MGSKLFRDPQALSSALLFIHNTHASRESAVLKVSPTRRTSQIEWMILPWGFRIIPAHGLEGVGIPTLDHDSWNKGIVDIPGNSPACSIYIADTQDKT